MQGDSITSWLKTLMADAFYWTDNDLVVQTRSMYGGAPRAAGATFLLDQGGAVSHFSYFSNERTAEAIVSAVMQPSPQGFRVIGPLSWAGESSTGVRGPAAAGGKPASEKPAVFLLPGILGSNLKIDGKRIRLGWRLLKGLKRLEYEAGQPDGVEPDGPISFYYQDLADSLRTPTKSSSSLSTGAGRWRRRRGASPWRLKRPWPRARRAVSRCASSRTPWAAWSRARCSSNGPRCGSG
jgi:hypothetical protein